MLIHLAHQIAGGRGQRVQERNHSGHILVGLGKGGKRPLFTVGCCGSICLEHQFTLV
jgi:hypothetical protein